MSDILNFLKPAMQAKKVVSQLSDNQKANLLNDIADELLDQMDLILGQNKKDLALMNPEDSKYDRLKLTTERIRGIAQSVKQVAQLPDPSNQIVQEKEIRDELFLQKRMVPMGCVGVIYESRPNVTVDVAALCLRSGNVTVLKGGKEAHFSNTVLVEMVQKVLVKNGIPAGAVTL